MGWESYIIWYGNRQTLIEKIDSYFLDNNNPEYVNYLYDTIRDYCSGHQIRPETDDISEIMDRIDSETDGLWFIWTTDSFHNRTVWGHLWSSLDRSDRQRRQIELYNEHVKKFDITMSFENYIQFIDIINEPIGEIVLET